MEAGNATMPFATIDQYADRLQVHRNTVKGWLRNGLPHVKLGQVVRIEIECADTWLREQTAARESRASQAPAPRPRRTRRRRPPVPGGA